VKRIVLGVGEDGRSSVLIEGPPRPVPRVNQQLEASAEEPKERVYLVWSTPNPDSSARDYAAEMTDFNFRLSPGEVRFLRVEIAPGAESPMHRTPYTNEYLVAISGELTMYAEDGTSSIFQAGDSLVQLAGWHYWRNDNDAPFVMAGAVVGVESDLDIPSGVELSL